MIAHVLLDVLELDFCLARNGDDDPELDKVGTENGWMDVGCIFLQKRVLKCAQVPSQETKSVLKCPQVPSWEPKRMLNFPLGSQKAC